MIPIIRIADREIGPGRPCFIIAEAGVNHNGSLDMALDMVEAAKSAGADAVKFQTFHAVENISPLAPKADYQLQTTGSGESQLDMVTRLELSQASFRAIQEHCRKCGVLFLSTPFDIGSVELLEELEVPAFKIASGEITYFPLIAHAAAKHKPLIISTGMSNLEEIAAAMEVARVAGNRETILLHCVSNYPASAASANLRAMRTMEDYFEVPVGFSDHTEGIAVALAAVALGACVIEKHFTLDRDLLGPDHKASLEPAELAALAAGIRAVEAALGTGEKRPVNEELSTAAVARRSLVANRDLPAGAVLTEDMIAMQRPGTGLPPSMLSQVLGRRLLRDIPRGTALTVDMLS